MKKFMALALALVMVVALAACGQQAAPAAQQAAPAAEQAAPAADQAAPAAESTGRVFGVTYQTFNNSFFVAMNNGLQAAVEADGNKLIALDPQFDQAKQISQVEDMIAQGAEAIILNCVDWQGVRPALDACQKAGIPVICVDTPVYDVDMVVGTVASDNYLAGQLCAQDMMAKLDKARIVVLNMPSDKSAIDREQGFLDTIAGNANYEVIATQDAKGTLEDGLKVMENILQAHPDDIDVIFGINDPEAQGAYAALEAAGRTGDGILLYGVDGSPEAKAMIKAGQMTGTAAQFPTVLGSTAYEMLLEVLDGKEVEKDIAVPVKMITADNLNDFNLTDWD